MPGSIRISAAAAGAALVLLTACSGGGGAGNSGDQTTIDLAAVENGIEEVSSIIGVCRTGAGLRSTVDPNPVTDRVAWLARLLQRRPGANLRATWEHLGLGPVKPDDSFGDCGGRITYPSYNHSNGTTTGTLQFDNYCSADFQTGEQSVTNGSISFVNHGTPSASGPITTSTEADSPSGVTLITKTSGGSQLSNQKLSFTDFLYDVGVPGGFPSASNPDEITLADSRVTDQVSGKSYRQSDLDLIQFTTASGGQQQTMSARLYRSSGEYFDMNTTIPVVTNASGAYTGGQFTFTGANGSTAVMTLVPGATLQATMTVNGTPVTNVPACH